MLLDPSVRRQGSVEALNLMVRSVAEAVAVARADAKTGQADNLVAGQLMAFGQVIACIERERDLLQQQLIQDAGLHAPPSDLAWDAELVLLRQLPLSSEELFRLAMDFRKMPEIETPEAAAESADAAGNSDRAASLAQPETRSAVPSASA